MIQYRVCWSASSNISFKGASDWREWTGDEELTADEVAEFLMSADGEEWSPALQEAVDISGFEYRVEMREAEEASA